jgi:deoxyadenosine/deoxycytidine kinase
MDQQVDSTKVIIQALRERRIRIISVEGSIGAGKSSLMEALYKHICADGRSAITAHNRGVMCGSVRYLVVAEPIKSWTDQLYETRPLGSEDATVSEQKSILKLFYGDMKRWGFLFQVKAFTSRLRLLCEQLGRLALEYTEEGDQIVVLSERSLITDRIFFRNLYEHGVVTPAEWEIYNEFYETVTTEVSKHHELMLYVDTPPAKCDERVKRRDREGEDDIPMQYMLDLDDQHKRMLSDFVQESKRQVLHVAFSDDLTREQISERAATLLREITALIHCTAGSG